MEVVIEFRYRIGKNRYSRPPMKFKLGEWTYKEVKELIAKRRGKKTNGGIHITAWRIVV